MSKSKKSPKRKINPKVKKEPRTSPQNLPESTYHRRPAWKLGLIDFAGPWNCEKIDSKECLLRIHNALKDFENKTWAEINDRKNNHPMPVHQLSREAKKRLTEINLDEYDTLYRLTISNKERLWGILDQEYLSIVWWDPNHTVYMGMPGTVFI